MDVERFRSALIQTLESEHQKNGIGTYSEGTLHAVLKKYYEPSSDRHELKVGKFVADIVCEDGIIEIQTRQLFRMKEKIKVFLEVSDVTVVHPIAAVKHVSWRDVATGEVSGRRKSPRKNTVYDAIGELYSLYDYVLNPGFRFVVVLLEMEEFKDYRLNKQGKKTDIRRYDRVPLRIISEENFSCKEDYRRLVPEGLSEVFTSADFAKKAGIRRPLAQLVLHFLFNIGVVSRVDRDKNGYIYSVSR